MTKAKVALSLVLVLLLISQWLVPSHRVTVTAHPVADATHAAHTKDHTVPAQPQHSCCEQDGASSAHGDLCCVGCPALPSVNADFFPYSPYLLLALLKPQEQSFVSLTSLWHPPTL